MNSRPFIVAEISGNHRGFLERAIKIVDAAKEAGADSVKLQTFTPEGMVADRNYTIQNGPWAGERLYDLYCKTQTPWEWHPIIFEYCKKIGIQCFSTPFHSEAVDFLETLDCPVYKVASFEITDLPLIRYIARTGKPMIISTGMATVEEIDTALDVAITGGCSDITLLKCTSAYPADPGHSNIAAMADMRKLFNVRTGLSDHTLGIGVSIAAAVLGASMIEKHLTLDDEPTPDSHFSLRPHEFKQMVTEIRQAVESIGEPHIGPSLTERQSLIFRRSIYAVKDLHEGDELTQDNIAIRRPALGPHPSFFEAYLGLRVNRDISAGTPLPEMIHADYTLK